jgi:hypothetical protein
MKEEKKETEVVVFIIIGIIILALIPVIYEAIAGAVRPYINAYYPIIFSIGQHAFGWIIGITIPISVLLLIGIVTAVEGTKHVRRKEALLYDIHVEMAYDDNAKGDPELSKKWATVMNHADSPNASDWRQAIIEADIILGEILTRMGYQGQSIGEQMTGISKGDFHTIDEAWEAHKIRNQIAHEGSDFALSQHEAKRVVGLYRKVFEEFFYI